MLRPLIAALALTALPATAQEMRQITDDADRTIEVPADPQRIVVLADQIIGTSLIELDANVVAGTARLGQPDNYYRGMFEQFGVTPETLPVASIQEQFDFERIQSFDPDLIVGLPFAIDYLDQLSQIAPTFIYSNHDGDPVLEQYAMLADLVNRTERYDELNAEYRARLEEVRADLFPGGTEMTYVAIRPDPDNGMIETYRHYGAVTSVPDDLGLTHAPVIDTLPEGVYEGDFSAEAAGEFNMDYLLTTYRPHTGGTAANIYDDMARVIPGYEAFMVAAQNDHIISMVAEEVVPHTFASMHNVLDAFEANAAQ